MTIITKIVILFALGWLRVLLLAFFPFWVGVVMRISQSPAAATPKPPAAVKAATMLRTHATLANLLLSR